ncbi:uncharacterized protein TrAFT101_000767 [Trichoderma asperellum]|uniref:Thioredoxin domain-containing protein n=1 Tax=Trichoderma asperellum (strain ATCC 204424 / CBS 433.97 / NBRC 101777) TaxID=1042311 RepID=A0A2T3ZKH7_TRIA4|nr:hypothetical protein M441DRAFT_64975 [Trichoderma asperellum CBS 433.97]PTB45309.1 hypothetical protein M441DRAFT_64975 [Trichoderma asperellum CBS 433.97]UKZ84875.1 hypothetical protein TrAFT101_000767 [Trichoderma asperellum]
MRCVLTAVAKQPFTLTQRRLFSASAACLAKNQVFDSIRTPASFDSQLSLSTSLGIPLLTLWSTAWCPSCRTIEPLLRSLVSSGVGEQEGGVLFAPVQFDTPEMMSTPIPLASRYSITSTPTLLSFDGGEARASTKVMDARKLADRQFLIDWIRNEAKRHESGGGGSASFGGLFNSR